MSPAARQMAFINLAHSFTHYCLLILPTAVLAMVLMPNGPFGDDYELILRTFLTTRMVHIRKFGYIQYMNVASSGNTQRARNREIQRLVRFFAGHYAERIHQRFVELGVDDFIWDGGELDWNVPNPDPTPIANYVYDGA